MCGFEIFYGSRSASGPIHNPHISAIPAGDGRELASTTFDERTNWTLWARNQHNGVWTVSHHCLNLDATLELTF